MKPVSSYLDKMPLAVKALVATLMALAFTYFLKYDIMSISFFAPMEKVTDYSFGDFYTSVSNNDFCGHYEGGLALVPVDSCSEIELAEVISKVDSLNPAAVGLDITYTGKPCAKDSELPVALSGCRNLVLPVYLDEENGKKTIVHESYMDTIVTPSLGFAVINIGGDDKSLTTVRKFRKTPGADQDDIMTLPVALVSHVHPDKIDNLFEQRDDEMLINYLEQIDTVYPSELDENSFKIENAIVLIGNIHDYSDMHISPLGIHTPGLVIHGLSIATILSGNYIWTPNAWESFLIGAILCYLITFLNFKLKDMVTRPLIIRTLQFAILILMIFVGSFAFRYINVDLNFSYALLAVTVGVASCEVYEGLFDRKGLFDLIESRYRVIKHNKRHLLKNLRNKKNKIQYKKISENENKE